MYSLTLLCPPEQAELLQAELWDWGALALSEEERSRGTRIVAGFQSLDVHAQLIDRFAQFDPVWESDDTDWIAETKQAWPCRSIGERLFLAPVWNDDPTPDGRLRIRHNPGLASGTGEHPCTRLALEALQATVRLNALLVDVGTGSGILSVAACQLGARCLAAIDTDESSLAVARENFAFNRAPLPPLVAGSADCLADASADIVVANISGTVILSILDDLLRVRKPEGTLVLTGFMNDEAGLFLRLFPAATIQTCHEWCCLTVQL